MPGSVLSARGLPALKTRTDSAVPIARVSLKDAGGCAFCQYLLPQNKRKCIKDRHNYPIHPSSPSSSVPLIRRPLPPQHGRRRLSGQPPRPPDLLPQPHSSRHFIFHLLLLLDSLVFLQLLLLLLLLKPNPTLTLFLFTALQPTQRRQPPSPLLPLPTPLPCATLALILDIIRLIPSVLHLPHPQPLDIVIA